MLIASLFAFLALLRPFCWFKRNVLPSVCLLHGRTFCQNTDAGSFSEISLACSAQGTVVGEQNEQISANQLQEMMYTSTIMAVATPYNWLFITPSDKCKCDDPSFCANVYYFSALYIHVPRGQTIKSVALRSGLIVMTVSTWTFMVLILYLQCHHKSFSKTTNPVHSYLNSTRTPLFKV